MRVQPLRPILASSAAQLPTGNGWSYEVKFDGYRTLALKDGSRVKLLPPVPEPSAIGLLAVGLATAGVLRRVWK